MSLFEYTTVLGRVRAADLGHCQPHEHIYLEATPATLINPLLCMDRLELSNRELQQYRVAGGTSLVDAQPVGAGRNAVMLQAISRQSGVHVIASTGYHVPMFYKAGHWIHSASEDQLAELFSSELSEGMFLDGQSRWPRRRSGICAGLVKAAMTGTGLSGETIKLLRAAGRAAVSQGAPLMLHTESGHDALAAISLLCQLGLHPDRILVCHADRQAADLEPHVSLAEQGVYLEYDTIGRFRYHDDEAEIRLISQMIEKGFLERILLSLDTTAGRFHFYGGETGLDYLLTRFLPMMQSAGLTSSQCRQMTRVNPALALRRIGNKENDA